MNSALASFLYKLLSLLLSVSLFFSPLASVSGGEKIEPKDKNSVQLTAALWSDTHLSDYLLSRTRNVKTCIEDLQTNAGHLDALIIDGDLTENGKLSELRMLSDELSGLSTVSSIIPATGNHDVRLRNFSLTVKTFSEFAASVNLDLDLDKLYYRYTVNGYDFIVLGTTRTEFEEAKLSDGELAFLDGALAAATSEGKPAFVLLHQPLKNTHDLPDAWGSPIPSAGSVGAESDKLTYILNKYENVFLITGHLHSGLGPNNFEDVGRVHCVNLPSIGIVSKDGGYEAAGTGYVMEVYEKSVLFRARSFLTGKFLPEFDREIPLV